MDILDWLENQTGAEHRIAADEIKLLRKQTMPDGYVLVRKTAIVETPLSDDPEPLI